MTSQSLCTRFYYLWEKKFGYSYPVANESKDEFIFESLLAAHTDIEVMLRMVIYLTEFKNQFARLSMYSVNAFNIQFEDIYNGAK